MSRTVGKQKPSNNCCIAFCHCKLKPTDIDLTDLVVFNGFIYPSLEFADNNLYIEAHPTSRVHSKTYAISYRHSSVRNQSLLMPILLSK